MMRNVFLLLVLANLLFFGWQAWIAPQPVVPDQLINRGPEPDISGASPRVTASAPVTPARLDASDAPRCLRLGPVADGATADALQRNLVTRGMQASSTSEEGQIWVGHWVQLESVATRQEADAIASRLAAGGLPDAYVLQTSPPFAISLGVFRDRARADKVAADAARLGFKPQTTDRYRVGVQYWLDVVIPPGGTLSLEDLGRETGQILRAEPRNCPAAAIGGGGPIN